MVEGRAVLSCIAVKLLSAAAHPSIWRDMHQQIIFSAVDVVVQLRQQAGMALQFTKVLHDLCPDIILAPPICPYRMGIWQHDELMQC